jgi:hypothetical protein
MKDQKKKKTIWPNKLTPGGQFHSIHEIPEGDFLDGALVGAGSLKPSSIGTGYLLRYGLLSVPSFEAPTTQTLNRPPGRGLPLNTPRPKALA